eukprot:m.67456 g.67456  ORF g.67456 m.67456 type:complete len:221 (+) comp9866_c0_seq1:60-722(+)
MMLALVTSAVLAAPLAPLDSKVLVTFGPGKPTSFTFKEMDDPVMGGKSIGNWSVVGDVGTFQGVTAIVPALKAPGFCSVGSLEVKADAGDYVSGSLVLSARTTTPQYAGFKISLGAIGVPHHHDGHELVGSYKANFTVPAGTDFSDVIIPFKMFSSDWSDFTGNCFTKDPDGYQHLCCTPENSDVCPKANLLAKIIQIQIWAEGVEGDFHLDIQSISAAM